MNTPHQPSHRQAVIFFFFTLVLALGIFLWVFFINKGTITVTENLPLKMKVSSEDIMCTASPCGVTLAPGKYTVTLTKDGYFDYTENITVNRREVTKITPKFDFIPTLSEVTNSALPFATAPLRPPFLGQKSLTNFPKNVKAASFSASGNLALLTLGKDLYIYDVKNKTVNGVILKPDAKSVWAGEKIVFLETSESIQTLKARSPVDAKYSPVASFEKPFAKPELLGDLRGEKVLISDENEAGHIYYLVDIVKQSRKRLEIIPASATAVKWTLGHIVYQKGVNEKVYTVDPDTLTETSMPAMGIENLIEPMSDVFFFIASEKQDTGKTKVGLSIADALEAAQQEAASPEQKKIKTVFVTQFNKKDNIARTLVEVPLKESESISRLTREIDGNNLYFVKGGKAFVVATEK